jgi:uncharacterized damage-inducible protein DinB
MNHCLRVSQIFAAHLVGKSHGLSTDDPLEPLALEELHSGIVTVDRWYLDYMETVTPTLLSEAVPFVFTDGDKGYMTREEMLTHVVIHNGYHRGEVGRLMMQAAARTGASVQMPWNRSCAMGTELSARTGASVQVPWDTYAVHLHCTEPVRRLQGGEPTKS